MSFLHPIRMYLFTSAVFFLVFFSSNSINFGNTFSGENMSTKDRLELAEDYRDRLKKDPDDSAARKIIALLTDTTKTVSGPQVLALDPKPVFTISGNQYTSLKEYDSAQNALPSSKRDSWFRHLLVVKAMKFNEKYKGRSNEGTKIFWEAFLHRVPYMLFLSLPFFALILKLLYVRRRNFYYSDHAIFTIYHYILSFILLLIVFGMEALQSKTGWEFLSYPMLAILIAWPLYLLLEMKNFYRQGWLKTIGKFVILDFLGMIVMVILFLGFVFLSLFEL